MGLFDIDKGTPDRSAPQPNRHDTIIEGAMKAHSTTSINPVTDATTTIGFLKTANGQILGNNGTNNIGLFGFDSTGNMVVKVAKPGFDADTATNDELIFNSGQNVFKIVDRETTTIPAFTAGSGGNNYGLRPIAHGLTFTPTIAAFASGAWVKGDTGLKTSTYIPLPIFAPAIGFGYLFPVSGGGYYSANVIYGVDSTNIYFQAETLSSLAAVTMSAIPITYYILQETAS